MSWIKMQYGYFVLVMITENHNVFSLSWLTVLSEHMRSPLGFSGIFRFLCRSLSFCHFAFGHCIDCPSLAIVLTALLWPLYWLPFFNLRILITFLASSNIHFIMCFIVIIPDLSAVCWVIWFNHLPRNNTKLFLKGKSLSSVTWTTEHIWLNGMQDLNLTNATIHIHLDINKVVLLCHD